MGGAATKTSSHVVAVQDPVLKAKHDMRLFRYKLYSEGVKFDHILDPHLISVQPHHANTEKAEFHVERTSCDMTLYDRLALIDEPLSVQEKERVFSALLHTLLSCHNHGYFNLSINLKAVVLKMRPRSFEARVFVSPEQLMRNPDFFDEGYRRAMFYDTRFRGAKAMDMAQVASIIGHVELHTLDRDMVLKWLAKPYPESGSTLCKMQAVVFLLLHGSYDIVTSAHVIDMFFRDQPGTTLDQMAKNIRTGSAALPF